MTKRNRLITLFLLCGLVLPGILGCNIFDYIIWHSQPDRPTLTPTVTLDPNAPTQTPTPLNCFWNWAYGDGSEVFDRTVEQKLAEQGIQVTVSSVSYGETYSCARTYYPRSLDVNLQITVAGLGDLETLKSITDQIRPILIKELPISEIGQIGNVSLDLVDASENHCYWNFTESRCAE